MKNFSSYITGLFVFFFTTSVAFANGADGDCGMLNGFGGHMGGWGMGFGQLSPVFFWLGMIVHLIIWLIFIAASIFIARKVWDASGKKKK